MSAGNGGSSWEDRVGGGAADPDIGFFAGAPVPILGAVAATSGAEALPPSRRGLPHWVTVGIWGPLAVCVLGLLATFAIPAAIDRHYKPVLPDTLNGNAKNTDDTAMREQLRKHVRGRSSPANVDSAWYGHRYMLTAYYDERADAAEKFHSLGVVGAPTSFGHVQCGASPATARLPAGRFSLCLRQGSKGYVELDRFGADGPLSDLAALTQDVWSAQPFAE